MRDSIANLPTIERLQLAAQSPATAKNASFNLFQKLLIFWVFANISETLVKATKKQNH
jgi:hypothetical protein